MLITLTQYRSVAKDEQGKPVAMGSRAGLVDITERTTHGAFPALDAATRYIKISASEAITVDPLGEREVLQSVDWWQVEGGEVVTTTAVP